jgi:hypothetical protein
MKQLSFLFRMQTFAQLVKILSRKYPGHPYCNPGGTKNQEAGKGTPVKMPLGKMNKI